VNMYKITIIIQHEGEPNGFFSIYGNDRNDCIESAVNHLRLEHKATTESFNRS